MRPSAGMIVPWAMMLVHASEYGPWRRRVCGITHLLNLQDITGNNLGGLNLLEGTVTENDSLESKSLLQLLDNRTGLVFLNETNTGVKQQQGADDTEINPILETGSQNSGSL